MVVAIAAAAVAVVENETSGEGPTAVQGKAKGSGGGEASELPTRRIDGRGRGTRAPREGWGRESRRVGRLFGVGE